MFISRFLKRKKENNYEDIEGLIKQAPPDELDIEGKILPLKEHIQWSNNFPMFQFTKPTINR